MYGQVYKYILTAAAENIFREINDIQTIEREFFFKSLQEEYTFRIHFFFSLCDTVGVLLEIFLHFLPSMSIIQFLVNFFERGSALKIVRLDFLLKSLKFFWIHVIILFDLLLYTKKETKNKLKSLEFDGKKSF